MSKTVFDDTPPLGTLVTAAFLNALNNHRHTGENIDGAGAIDYAVSSGSGGKYVLTLAPALIDHIPGMPILFKANHANTGAATININSMGAAAIKKNVDSALAAGDIMDGQIVTVAYDGTNYQLLGATALPEGAANAKLFLNATGSQEEWATGIKVTTATRDLSASSGNVAYSGVGFKPSAVIIIAQGGGDHANSIGFTDFSAQAVISNNEGTSGASQYSSSHCAMAQNTLATTGQNAAIVSADTDGATLSWTKVGSPSGTVKLAFLWLR